MQLTTLRRRFLVTTAFTVAVAFAYGGSTRPGATILRTETALDPDPTAIGAATAGDLPEGLPLVFERNDSQLDRRVRFAARGEGYEVVLRPDGAWLVLAEGAGPATREIGIRFEGGQPARDMAGVDALAGQSHDSRGAGSTTRTAGVPSFTRVRASRVYDGIDVEYQGRDGQLDVNFVVAPGADAGRIALAFDGLDRIALDPTGDLLLQVGASTIRQHKPVAYQTTRNGRRSVQADFLLIGTRRVVIALGDYDHNLPLVIDPVLAGSS